MRQRNVPCRSLTVFSSSTAGSRNCGAFFDVDTKAARLAELEGVMADGILWSDPDRAKKVVEEVKFLKRWLEPFHALRKRGDDAREMAELVEAESHVDR